MSSLQALETIRMVVRLLIFLIVAKDLNRELSLRGRELYERLALIMGVGAVIFTVF